MPAPKCYLPGATIGVMGGGQLGRMFAMAARRMGYRVHIFTPEVNSPAEQLADHATVANFDDRDAVTLFASEIDFLTFEFENIPAQTVGWCAERCEVRPAGRILHIAQHRLREKEFLKHGGFPLAQYEKVANAEDLRRALDLLGRPAILKSAAFGYDGKGQRLIREGEDPIVIWDEQRDRECVLEARVDFEKEVSVIVARSPKGESAIFPVCENIHREHILDLTVAPARLSDRQAGAASELGRAIAESLDLVGLLAVEMFVDAEGDLIVNELAPRPHNSGHWTIEGCVTSQFEQHVRAVCGLPLGSTELLRPAAMTNLLGALWNTGEPGWSAALGEQNVHLHLYGKREPRPRRKMGHLTALAETTEKAGELAVRARDKLVTP